MLHTTVVLPLPLCEPALRLWSDTAGGWGGQVMDASGKYDPDRFRDYQLAIGSEMNERAETGFVIGNSEDGCADPPAHQSRIPTLPCTHCHKYCHTRKHTLLQTLYHTHTYARAHTRARAHALPYHSAPVPCDNSRPC